MRSGSSLARVIGRAQSPGDDCCELCSAGLSSSHRHLLDLHEETLRCVCRACALLFEREAAARGHYRLVPQRRTRLDARDADVGAPVGLAFYVRSEDGSAEVRYPGPLGATSGVVPPTDWSALISAWPQLADMAPLVEALLVNTARGQDEHWIVPIEDCYRLVGVIREHWTGISGGRDVWPAVDEFFASLRRSAPGRAPTGAAR